MLTLKWVKRGVRTTAAAAACCIAGSTSLGAGVMARRTSRGIRASPDTVCTPARNDSDQIPLDDTGNESDRIFGLWLR